MRLILLLISVFSFLILNSIQAQKTNFSALDVFDLQYASSPQISPDGEWIVYRRMRFDIMKDKAVGQLWMIRTNGSQHQKLTSREVSESSAKWSPNGDRLAFTSSTEEGSEIYIYWTGSGKLAKIHSFRSVPVR